MKQSFQSLQKSEKRVRTNESGSERVFRLFWTWKYPQKVLKMAFMPAFESHGKKKSALRDQYIPLYYIYIYNRQVHPQSRSTILNKQPTKNITYRKIRQVEHKKISSRGTDFIGVGVCWLSGCLYRMNVCVCGSFFWEPFYLCFYACVCTSLYVCLCLSVSRSVTVSASVSVLSILHWLCVSMSVSVLVCVCICMCAPVFVSQCLNGCICV